MDEKDLRITKMSAFKTSVEFVELCLNYELITCTDHKELFKYVVGYERMIVTEIIRKNEVKQ